MRRISASNTGAVTEGWRKVHSEELQLYFTLNMIMVTRSNMTGWFTHGVRTGEVKNE
jgi:hypothetical protein